MFFTQKKPNIKKEGLFLLFRIYFVYCFSADFTDYFRYWRIWSLAYILKVLLNMFNEDQSSLKLIKCMLPLTFFLSFSISTKA